jgi:hypothetical protein
MAITVVAPYTPEWDMAGAFSQARITYASVQGDASYPSGGYTVQPSTFGLGTRIIDVILGTVAVGSAGYQVFYDNQAGTLRFFIPTAATATEVAVGTNLATVLCNCVVIGW